jgi:charged multivesicular body protein 4
MQQEQLDEQMLKSGTVPVSDSIHRMPTVANGERKLKTGPVLLATMDRGLICAAAVKGKTPIAEEEDEEAELRKLQAEMAM